MADREKVVRALECLSRNAQNGPCNGCAYFRPFTDDPDTGWCDRTAAMADALALLREQEPRVMRLEEIKAIALREAERILSTEVEPVWLEQNEGGLTRLVLVLISWWYMEGLDKDETEFEFIVKYFGTELDDTLNYLDYGTRWRVWSSKPSIEQRKAAKWNATD